MTSSSEGGHMAMGASLHAHELAKRRVSGTPVPTPTTPVTPLALSTPVLAAHIFSEGNIMEDLQLAAELGKTLLERNKELESTIKEQRAIIDDKVQQIEHLSKQTTALREVNDSRLRIYEQLEISIQDLEKTNQRLIAETTADKKKIKNLTSTIDQLEAKCDDLQRSLDEAKTQEKRREQSEGEEEQEERRKSLTKKILSGGDDSPLKRSLSCGNNAKYCEELAVEFVELQIKMEDLEAKLRYLEDERRLEIKKREDLEIELEVSNQENEALKEQLMVLKDRTINIRSFEDELASIEDTSSSKICRKCMGLAEETGSNMTMQDLEGDDLEEETDVSYDDIQGECALIKLKNGGYAWGSQESLASMGQVVNCVGSSGSSPRTDGSEAPNSLLSELDTQYRILIAKYEALLEAREHQHQQQEQDQLQNSGGIQNGSIVDSGVDEVSGPMSIVMTKPNADEQSLCQRCTTCTCNLKIPNQESKNNFEEHSEVETSSSGFSEGEPRTCFVSTQTDNIHTCCCKENHDPTTPIAYADIRYLDLYTPLNPCERRFQNTPVYQKIFHEIFEVLKKDIARENVSVAVTRTLLMRGGCCKLAPCSRKRSDAFLPSEDDENKVTNNSETSEVIEKEDHEILNRKEEIVTNDVENISIKDEAIEKLAAKDVPKEIENKEKENLNVSEKLVNNEQKLRDEDEENKNPNVIESEERKELCEENEEQKSKEVKPHRPDFLDLEASSRCSSRSRRRKKNSRRHNSSSKHNRDSSEISTNEAKQSSTSSVALDKKESHRVKRESEQISSAGKETNTKKEDIPSNESKKKKKDSKTSSQSHQHQQTETKSNEEELTSKVTRTRCEHKKKRNRKHKVQQTTFQNKHLANVLGQNAPKICHAQQANSIRPAPQTLPSVQVAKLIKFEKTYAEALKSKQPDNRVYYYK